MTPRTLFHRAKEEPKEAPLVTHLVFVDSAEAGMLLEPLEDKTTKGHHPTLQLLKKGKQSIRMFVFCLFYLFSA